MITTQAENDKAVRELVEKIGPMLFEDNPHFVIGDVLAQLTAWWVVAYIGRDSEGTQAIRTEALKHFANQVIDFAILNEKLNNTEGTA